jgi:hypothetical protein
MFKYTPGQQVVSREKLNRFKIAENSLETGGVVRPLVQKF